MMNVKEKILSATLSVASAAFAAGATEPYVTVMKQGKVFDEPNAKGYVTLNTKNQEVSLMPGMVFKVMEDGAGWDLVEYSPGLRGYVSEQVTGTSAALPKAGTYKVANKPAETIAVTVSGTDWTASYAGKAFKGKAHGNAVVFTDGQGQPVYSLVVLEKGPVAMTYAPEVTGFF